MTPSNELTKALEELALRLEGDFHFDQLLRVIYATDASVYRALPLAVAMPKTEADIRQLIHFAKLHKTSLIPRAAGTSLAGQCVGEGIVVDISKHFNKILEFNAKEAWVRVQPGVVRDELNAFLRPFGYFFSPITSTANRAMLGGMVGNNSSGTTSIEYGCTRDKILALKVLLSDGTAATFTDLNPEQFQAKRQAPGLEGQLYDQIWAALSSLELQKAIQDEFPKPVIHRRNTGYALDALLNSSLFGRSTTLFNFGKLLCGSEGTLAFTTEITVKLDPLPPEDHIIVAAHFTDIEQSLLATIAAMKLNPSACELMDKIILDCTKENLTYRNNRFFIEGDPAIVLMVEFRAESASSAQAKGEELIRSLQAQNLGYAYPVIPAARSKEVWALRSAGLGLLANLPGDGKAVACIEDTAVAVEDLPAYIAEFEELMKTFDQQPVYYAHAGAGELHLRPILNLKKAEDVQAFYDVTLATAKLVKKYGGSLSGEHGDGRVRSTFIPMMVGEINYAFFRQIKQQWDPDGIFNPGKIVDALPMNKSLRYEPEQTSPSFETVLDFSNTGGILRAAEKCNGSGDCRKLPHSGGTMCPSYQATRDEKDTTRARANTLREFLTKSTQQNRFNHSEIKEVMDLCLSCKGCTSECPSNVDMAGLKAEFLHQYYQSNGIPLSARIFANINRINAIGSLWPGGFNRLLKNGFTAGILKKITGIAPERSLPAIHSKSLRKWFQQDFKVSSGSKRKTVYFFCDEFTNYNDTPIGRKAIMLLDRLGYLVKMIAHPESGRAAISKGLLLQAKQLATKNVSCFVDIISKETPLIGLEPSAILSFRDEYPRLVNKSLQAKADKLARHCLLIDEFLAAEIRLGKIDSSPFTKAKRQVLLHGHCHQKALSRIEDTIWVLSLPEHFSVELIPSGCCGMAGSFGYESEHHRISQQIGEMVLLPAVRKAATDTLIAATGTSCRHQIVDSTERKAFHPIEILWEALE